MKPEKIIELVVTQLQITREGTLRYNLNNAITMDEVDQKLQTLANLHAYLEKGFPRQSSSSPATHYSDAAKALNTLFLSNEKEKNEGWGDNSKDWTEVKTELDRITKYLRDRKAEMVAASAPKEATRSEQWKQKRASMSNDESSSSYDTDSPSYDNEINEHPTIRELNDQKMEAFSILTKFGPMFYGRKLNNDVEIDEELTSDEKLAQLEEAREQKVQYEYLCHVEKVVQDYESRIDWVRKKLHSLPVHSRNTVVEAPPAKVELKSFDAFTNPETKKTGHDVNAKKSNASSSSSYKSDSKHSAKADNGSVPEAPPMAPPMSNNSKSVATKTYSTAKSTPSKAPIAKAAASASSSKPHSNAAPVKGHNLDMNAARGKLAAAFAQDKANQHARASSASSSSSKAEVSHHVVPSTAKHSIPVAPPLSSSYNAPVARSQNNRNALHSSRPSTHIVPSSHPVNKHVSNQVVSANNRSRPSSPSRSAVIPASSTTGMTNSEFRMALEELAAQHQKDFNFRQIQREHAARQRQEYDFRQAQLRNAEAIRNKGKGSRDGSPARSNQHEESSAPSAYKIMQERMARSQGNSQNARDVSPTRHNRDGESSAASDSEYSRMLRREQAAARNQGYSQQHAAREPSPVGGSTSSTASSSKKHKDASPVRNNKHHESSSAASSSSSTSMNDLRAAQVRHAAEARRRGEEERAAREAEAAAHAKKNNTTNKSSDPDRRNR